MQGAAGRGPASITGGEGKEEGSRGRDEKNDVVGGEKGGSSGRQRQGWTEKGVKSKAKAEGEER